MQLPEVKNKLVEAGLIIATGVYLPIAALPEPQLLSWGWRVPFWLSAVVVAIGLFFSLTVGGAVAAYLGLTADLPDPARIEAQFTNQNQDFFETTKIYDRTGKNLLYEVIDERTVGPSLGLDSIRKGVYASVVGFVAVMLFMLVYYKLAGINAIAAVTLNLVILMGFMAYVGAVMTLPGIAGFILTIGMGVDSNVLVFERIREELRAGKANASAVDLGFERAFLTIIDTHVTTVVSAIFLFMFGTGPVRGFAVTLVIGLIANIFTSIYVSRAIFDWHLGRMQRQAELSI